MFSHQHRYHAYCLRVFRHAGEDVASVAVGGAPTHAGRLLKQSILFANGSNYFQICSVSSPVFWIRNRDSNCIRIQQLTDPDPRSRIHTIKTLTGKSSLSEQVIIFGK